MCAHRAQSKTASASVSRVRAKITITVRVHAGRLLKAKKSIPRFGNNETDKRQCRVRKILCIG